MKVLFFFVFSSSIKVLSQHRCNITMIIFLLVATFSRSNDTPRNREFVDSQNKQS